MSTMTSTPIGDASRQASRSDMPTAIWTANGDTGALPRYQEAPDTERMAQDYEATDTPAPVQNPIYNPGVDLAGFLRAQVSFGSEQTLFLERGRSLQGDDYVHALARFSRSQSALVKAHNVLLSQLGII